MENNSRIARMAFGLRLRMARQAKGMTAEKLAFALGVNPPCVHWWEHGRNYPMTERLIEMAKLLDVSIDWLVGREDDGA